MKVKGDVEGIKYVNKDSTAPTVIDIDLKGLKLDIRITATAGSDTYKSWETSENYKWTKTVTSDSTHYALELEKFTGTITTMQFVTSRMTPADYKPAKDLGHSITEELTVKFFCK